MIRHTLLKLYHLKPQNMLCETESRIHELRRSESKKGEARKDEQYYKWPERSVGNGYIVGFATTPAKRG